MASPSAREADDGGGKMSAAELAAEREEVMRDHNKVEERYQAETSGPTRRSSLFASSPAILAVEEALRPAAGPDWDSVEWINESHPRWIEIYAVVVAQLASHGFNFGSTQHVCWQLRKAFNDSTLSDEVTASLEAHGFKWSSVGACHVLFCLV